VLAIRTVGLTKRFGTVRRRPWRGGDPARDPATDTVLALDDLSIDVRPGEIFGFLGPNGAGKSTAIRLLLGYLRPSAGRATVLGHDISSGSVEIRRRVGYLPGGITFWDGLTGQRTLDELAGLSSRAPVRRGDLLDRLELDAATLRRPVRDYSRGMRQKLGIVQALQHDPELAVLDEPSEGLDPLMQRSFYGILDDLRAAGRTVFFSSHVLSEVERVCDRVAIVRHGRLVAVEDVAALIARRKRNVELRYDGPPPALDGVAGVSDLVRDGDRLACRLEGDVGPFLAALRNVQVRDLVIEPARLEEAFLEFYADDGRAAAGPAQVDPSGGIQGA
jgi:beta-exotoxin I transport system ATP-binding protein